jgi:hypothetical protein
VDCEGELRVGVGSFFVEVTLFQPASGAAETSAEGQMLVSVAEGGQEAPDLVSPGASGADDARGGGTLGPARLDALEQKAFECPTVLRAVTVNAAAGAVESRAGLRQARTPPGGAGSGNPQAEGAQARGVVRGPQFEIGEDNAVAAETARGTKLLDDWVAGNVRAVQAADNLRPQPSESNVACPRLPTAWRNWTRPPQRLTRCRQLRAPPPSCHEPAVGLPQACCNGVCPMIIP